MTTKSTFNLDNFSFSFTIVSPTPVPSMKKVWKFTGPQGPSKSTQTEKFLVAAISWETGQNQLKSKAQESHTSAKKKSTFTSHVFLKFYTELLIGLSDTEVMQLTHQINCQFRSQSTNNPRIAAPCCFSTTAVRGCFTVELPRQSVHSLLCYCARNSVLVQLPELRTSN